MDFERVRRCCEEYKVLRRQVKTALLKQTKDKELVVQLAIDVQDEFEKKMEALLKDNKFLVRNLQKYGSWITEIGNILKV